MVSVFSPKVVPSALQPPAKLAALVSTLHHMPLSLLKLVHVSPPGL